VKQGQNLALISIGKVRAVDEAEGRGREELSLLAFARRRFHDLGRLDFDGRFVRSQRDDLLLFGTVTRLWAQKGIDLLPPAFEALLAQREAQLVVLGTGDEDLHRALQQLEAAHPERVKVWLEFNPQLGQQIYGGCDVFMMPSRYEPCGLGQLISLRYGAVPLVRRTGGLADTVEDADADLRSGTGFVFDDATIDGLRGAIEHAAAAFANRVAWRAMQQRGMRQDWSWNRAADQYLALYDAARGSQVAK
jgi:starch synthase